jgi:general secretion pathway protein G
MRNASDAKTQAARAQIELLALAIDGYRLDVGSYPTTAQGLSALRSLPADAGDFASRWRGPYLRRVLPNDPWGRPYVYESPGRENPESYDLFTLGRDGMAGGDGEDTDVTSWGGRVGTR